jgi:hypothetical protein
MDLCAEICAYIDRLRTSHTVVLRKGERRLDEIRWKEMSNGTAA